MERRSRRNFVWVLWAALFTTSIGLHAEDQIVERLEAAQRAERAQDYASASREYQEILKLQPNLPLVRQSLAITYHLRNRYPEAISEFHRALRLDSTLWGACLFLGMDYYKINQFALAIQPLEKSISLNAKMAEPEARFWLGTTYSALNRQEDAVRELRRDLELRLKDADVLYSLTRAYDDSAAAVFERLGQIEPRSAAVSILQAERFMEENRADLARREYRNAVRLRPDYAGWIPALAGSNAPASGDSNLTISSSDAHANLELAALFSGVGDDRDSIAILENLSGQKGADAGTTDLIATAKARLEVIYHQPTNTRAQGSQEVLEGIELLRQGHFREARTPLSQACVKNPNPYLRLYLVRSYSEAGDYVLAEDEIRKFLLLEPKNIDALHLMGRNYKRQAEAALRQMIEIDADAYGVHELLGRQHEERTEFDLAIQEYQAALAKRPDAGGVRYEIGNVYRKMSQYDQAEHWLTEEIKRNPYHGLAQYRLGSVYIEQGKPDEAIPHLELALRYHPRLTDARLDLGRAYTAKGRYEEAIAALRQVVEAEPDNDRVHYLLSTAYSKQGKREEAQVELATYQRLTRRRLQRTQQDVRDASDSLTGK
jgi:tetratricopeptide (TPR) repeat protein